MNKRLFFIAGAVVFLFGCPVTLKRHGSTQSTEEIKPTQYATTQRS
jgi:hypothetical protein